MTIRVLMVGQFPVSLSRVDGGVQAATTYLSQALANLPDVELIGLRVAGDQSAGPAGELGWPVHTLDLGRLAVTTGFRRQKRLFASLVNKIRPDIIHAQGADVSGYLAVQSDRPVVVTIHGILTECGKLQTNVVRKLRELLQARITETFVVRQTRNLIAISPYVTRYYQSRISGRLFDIPNAIAPAFYSVSRRPEPGRILFAGRISRGKGVLDLVKAAAGQEPAVREIVLAGAARDQQFAAELRRMIRSERLQSKVRLAGLLDESALLSEFASASVLVLPSYQETSPMVVQQAMAAGLPVVATRVGGIPDLIASERSGLLFEPGDIKALRGLLSRLNDDRELGPRLAATARSDALNRFSAESVANQTLAAYKQVLGLH